MIYRKNPAALGGAISQNGGIQQSKGTQETGGKKAYYNPGKERSKIEKKVKKAEEELAVKEEKLDALKQELLRPEYQSSYSKLTEIQGEIDALEEEIMADMEHWEALSQQLEELESIETKIACGKTKRKFFPAAIFYVCELFWAPNV